MIPSSAQSSALHPLEFAAAPSHDEIAQCARELWTESGRPQGRDNVIWCEAERRLISARRAPADAAVVPRTRVSGA